MRTCFRYASALLTALVIIPWFSSHFRLSTMCLEFDSRITCIRAKSSHFIRDCAVLAIKSCQVLHEVDLELA